jgi:CHAD domain-containing protein
MSFAQKQTLARLEVFAQALDVAMTTQKAQEADNDAIHDLRVASRRFGQCLRIFEPLLDAGAAAKIRGKIRKLMDRCGAARNCDITLELLREAGIANRSKAVAQVQERRRDAELALIRHLKRWRHRDILESWSKRLFLSENQEFVPDLKALTAELFARGTAAAATGSRYAEMHQFRLVAKRYRYTVEVFEPLYDKASVEALLREMRGLQDRLGAMNDCVTALELVHGHGQATRAIRRMLQTRERAFRSYWKRNFGNRRLNQWTSIFSAMAKQNPAAPASRRPPASSRRAVAKTSAA